MNTSKLTCAKGAIVAIVALVLAVVMLPLSSYAYADPGDADTTQKTALQSDEVTYVPDEDFPDNDELFAGYVEHQFYGGSGISLYSTCGKDTLNSTEYAIYEKLKTNIKDVATGKQNATHWTIKASDLKGAKLTWSYSELGLSAGASGNDIVAAVKSTFNKEVPIKPLMSSLLADCPYDLYWFDKTAGMGMRYSMTYSPGRSVSITELMVGLFVSSDYSSTGAEGTLTTDKNKTSATTKAVTNAQAIIKKHQSENSSTKLTSYKNTICDLVTYNSSAASGPVPYGDPWQLIYVFDGDASTNVVCEGYAKAFQYLCDLTNWGDNTACYSVWGTMSGGTGAGGHMWNVVTRNGINYLADLTNSEPGTVGSDGSLFMVSATSSNCTQSSANGYTFKAGSGSNASIKYTYDSDMKTLYSSEILELGAKISLNGAVVASIPDQIYTGSALKPAVKVTLNGVALTQGEDYKVSYTDNTNAGTAKITITGVGNFTGKLNKEFTIKPRSISSSAKASSISDKTYTGGKLQPGVTVTLGNTILKLNKDYAVSYKNNTNAGRATVTIMGIGNYSGTLSKSFNITSKQLNTTTISVPNKTYTGSAIKPVTIKDGKKALKSGTDYTVKYSNNTKVGTAKVTITGKGNYTGSVTKTFKINRASIAKAKVTTKTQTYTGKTLKPNPTVKVGKKTLKKNTDYTLTYKNNVKSGKATVTIKGKGNYAGTITKSFNIKPAKVTGVKASSSKKGKVTVKWSSSKGKAANVSGYKITVKYGSKTIKNQYVSGKSAKSKTITLASKYKGKKVKTYVYAYKSIGKSKVYSTASSAKTVRVKR